MRKVQLPLTAEIVDSLTAGETVYLSGEIFTARDMAHKRLVQLIEDCQPLPFDIANATIYYAGAVFEGEVPLSAGPTTSSRMDTLTPQLLKCGLKGMIGKGDRSKALADDIVRFGAVYFAAVGGAGAFYAQKVVSSRLVAFPSLGCEAVYRFVIKDFPVIVAIDSRGNSVYN